MTDQPHTAAPSCAEDNCRAWAVRIGENPDTITCYLCRPSVIPPGKGGQ